MARKEKQIMIFLPSGNIVNMAQVLAITRYVSNSWGDRDERFSIKIEREGVYNNTHLSYPSARSRNNDFKALKAQLMRKSKLRSK